MQPVQSTSAIKSAAIIQAIAQGEAAAANRLADLTLNVDEAAVNMERPYLGIIVEELVNNALKYSELSTRVTVTARRKDGGLQLQVKNFG